MKYGCVSGGIRRKNHRNWSYRVSACHYVTEMYELLSGLIFKLLGNALFYILEAPAAGLKAVLRHRFKILWSKEMPFLLKQKGNTYRKGDNCPQAIRLPNNGSFLLLDTSVCNRFASNYPSKPLCVPEHGTVLQKRKKHRRILLAAGKMTMRTSYTRWLFMQIGTTPYI